MAWTFCTSAAAITKAGKKVNTYIKASGALLSEFSNQSEATINKAAKYDYIANYATIGSNFVNMLSEVASSMIANKMIMYDMSGYTSRFEAVTMLNVNHDLITSNMKDIEDKDVQAL